MQTVVIVLAVLAVVPILLPIVAIVFNIRPLKLWMSGYGKWSRCWLGQHRWSMPGGWCERCGICDTFFGGHETCGKTCCHWEGPQCST
jgi:hypothetical protein